MEKNISRPQRKQIKDFAGRLRTLPDDISAWITIADPPLPGALLLLGLGPEAPANLPFGVEAKQKRLPVYWLDSPVMQTLGQNPPDSWQKTDDPQAMTIAKNAKILLYRPGIALDPDFWLPILAKLEKQICNALPATHAKTFWLPGTPQNLLHQELTHAAKERGFTKIVTASPANANLSSLLECWQGEIPAFALSVNFRGLDPGGRIFTLCQELGMPLAIWLVDNPWNLLSGIALPWWKKAHLFMTDPSFLPLLQQYGCQSSHFCPLAASWHMQNIPQNTGVDTQVARNVRALFVGRAGFAEQNSFFRGVRLPQSLLTEAERLPPSIPDWHWWNKKIAAILWPGLAMRQISYGADLFSGRNRASWLKSNETSLRIIGDASWQSLLPEAKIEPPVDYYGCLPQLYRDSLATLNITSLLLPQSLSQRHFDVWTAGGFLLSDATRGLNIFPQELTKPITLSTPEELPQKLDWLAGNPARRQELRHAWQEEILARHLYANRLDFITRAIGSPTATA